MPLLTCQGRLSALLGLREPSKALKSANLSDNCGLIFEVRSQQCIECRDCALVVSKIGIRLCNLVQQVPVIAIAVADSSQKCAMVTRNTADRCDKSLPIVGGIKCFHCGLVLFELNTQQGDFHEDLFILSKCGPCVANRTRK